jgi:hypothetical protein
MSSTSGIDQPIGNSAPEDGPRSAVNASAVATGGGDSDLTPIAAADAAAGSDGSGAVQSVHSSAAVSTNASASVYRTDVASSSAAASRASAVNGASASAVSPRLAVAASDRPVLSDSLSSLHGGGNGPGSVFSGRGSPGFREAMAPPQGAAAATTAAAGRSPRVSMGALHVASKSLHDSGLLLQIATPS